MDWIILLVVAFFLLCGVGVYLEDLKQRKLKDLNARYLACIRRAQQGGKLFVKFQLVTERSFQDSGFSDVSTKIVKVPVSVCKLYRSTCERTHGIVGELSWVLEIQPVIPVSWQCVQRTDTERKNVKLYIISGSPHELLQGTDKWVTRYIRHGLWKVVFDSEALQWTEKAQLLIS